MPKSKNKPSPTGGRRLSVRLKKVGNVDDYEVSPPKKKPKIDSPKIQVEYEVSPVKSKNKRQLVTTLRLSRSPTKSDIGKMVKSPPPIERVKDKLQFSPRKSRRQSTENFQQCQIKSPTKLRLIRSPVKSRRASGGCASAENIKENIVDCQYDSENTSPSRISMKVRRKSNSKGYSIVDAFAKTVEKSSKEDVRNEKDEISPATQRRLSVRMRKPPATMKGFELSPRKAKDKGVVPSQRSITMFFKVAKDEPTEVAEENDGQMEREDVKEKVEMLEMKKGARRKSSRLSVEQIEVTSESIAMVKDSDGKKREELKVVIKKDTVKHSVSPQKKVAEKAKSEQFVKSSDVDVSSRRRTRREGERVGEGKDKIEESKKESEDKSESRQKKKRFEKEDIEDKGESEQRDSRIQREEKVVSTVTEKKDNTKIQIEDKEIKNAPKERRESRRFQKVNLKETDVEIEVQKEVTEKDAKDTEIKRKEEEKEVENKEIRPTRRQREIEEKGIRETRRTKVEDKDIEGKEVRETRKKKVEESEIEGKVKREIRTKKDEAVEEEKSNRLRQKDEEKPIEELKRENGVMRRRESVRRRQDNEELKATNLPNSDINENVEKVKTEGMKDDTEDEVFTSPDGQRSSRRARKLTTKMEDFKQAIAKKMSSPRKGDSVNTSLTEEDDQEVDVEEEAEGEGDRTERRLSGRQRKMPSAMEGFVLGTGRRRKSGAGEGEGERQSEQPVENSTEEAPSKRRRSSLLSSAGRPGKRKRHSLDSAVEEANGLLDSLAHDRLQHCQYRPAAGAQDEEDVGEDEEEEIDVGGDSDPSEAGSDDDEIPTPKPRGRPKLYPEGFKEHMRKLREMEKAERQALKEAVKTEEQVVKSEEQEIPNETESDSVPKRKVGRPRKSDIIDTPVSAKRGPGRPRKCEVNNNITVDNDQEMVSDSSDDEDIKYEIVRRLCPKRSSLPKRFADDFVDPSDVLAEQEEQIRRRREAVRGGRGPRGGGRGRTPNNMMPRKRRVMDVEYDDGWNTDEDDERSMGASGSTGTPSRAERDTKFLQRMECRMLVGSPGWLRNHGHRTWNCNLMSLKEKFAEDKQLYRDNKRRFERDLRRFMWRNGKISSKPPCWHGEELNLFQLYMAVYDLGGSDMVTANKKWLAMYKDIFGPKSHKVQTAHGLKTFYMRNMLAYERYVSGEDYEDALYEARDINPNKVTHVVNTDSEDSSSEQDEYEYAESTGRGGGWGSEIASNMSESTQEMLSELQVQASQASAYDILKEKVQEESSKMDLNILFYDDNNMVHSLPVSVQTASESGAPDQPEPTSCCLQEVPDLSTMIVTSEHDPILEVAAVPLSLLSSPDQVLHELQTLGEEISTLTAQHLNDEHLADQHLTDQHLTDEHLTVQHLIHNQEELDAFTEEMSLAHQRGEELDGGAESDMEEWEGFVEEEVGLEEAMMYQKQAVAAGIVELGLGFDEL